MIKVFNKKKTIILKITKVTIKKEKLNGANCGIISKDTISD